MGVEFWHTHFSSRFNRSAEGLENLLDKCAEFTDLFTVTEISNNVRAATLWEHGWGASLPDPKGGPRDDCGQAWIKTVFTMVDRGTFKLSGWRFVRDDGGWAEPLIANFAVLEASNGNRLLSAVAHLGHGIEGDLSDGKADGYNAKVYRYDFWALVRKANKIAEKNDCDSVMISFDGNLDLKMPWVRLLFKAWANGYRINWNRPFPRRGTFWHRLIDVTIYKGRIRLRKGPRLVSQDGTSDHPYGYSEQFELLQPM